MTEPGRGENRRDKHVETLIEENMRLVLKIANDFLRRGLPWEDLVSEGNRGLMTAAERFDPSRGTRFSTYSAWWIKQAIRQALAEQAPPIRIPIGTQLNLRRIRKAQQKLFDELGREPTDPEIAEEAVLPLATIKRLRRKHDLQMQSLNESLVAGEEEGSEFINFLSDEGADAPDGKLIAAENIEQLLQLLDTLPERERQVIRLRFGLDGEPVRTLDEVGEMLHCTNERVRQIQNHGLHRLQQLMEKEA